MDHYLWYGFTESRSVFQKKLLEVLNSLIHLERKRFYRIFYWAIFLQFVLQAIKEFSKSRLRRKDKASYFRRPRGRGLRGARGGRGGPPGNNTTNHNTSDPLYLIRGEVAVLKKLNHINVVKLYEVLDDPSNDSLYMGKCL